MKSHIHYLIVLPPSVQQCCIYTREGRTKFTHRLTSCDNKMWHAWLLILGSHPASSFSFGRGPILISVLSPFLGQLLFFFQPMLLVCGVVLFLLFLPYPCRQGAAEYSHILPAHGLPLIERWLKGPRVTWAIWGIPLWHAKRGDEQPPKLVGHYLALGMSTCP